MTKEQSIWVVQRVAALLFVGFVLVAAVYLLRLSADSEPIHDQLGLLEPTFADGYPSFQDGITSYLIVRLLHFVGPDQQPAFNFLVRIFAALFFLGAGMLLGWQTLRVHRLPLFGLFVLLLFTSRYPFLWLSSELFAGTFLMLFLWSYMTERPLIVTSTLLAFYATSKPDLILPALLIAAFLILTQTRANPQKKIGYLTALVALPFILILAPTFLPNSGGATSQAGRSFVSFCQHYADMVSQHQTLLAGNPWTECLSYVTASFGPVDSVVGVVASSLPRYMDFVFLSISFSIRRLLLGNTLLLLPPVLYGFYLLWQYRQQGLGVLFLLLLTNLIPIILLSYVHIRYQARFYPLFLLAAFLPFRSNAIPWRDRAAVALYLLLLLFVQSVQFRTTLSSGIFFLD